ncbi:MAG TPA: DinB family protein [Vicinamibacteria bacterium]|nr:DinB family protein [Vicinamibacteria bacterium]
MPELDPREIIEALERGPVVIVPLVREVPDHLRKRRPSQGKWSAHEHACHLAAVQPIFMERLRLMLEQDHPSIRSYQPDREHSPDALLTVDLDEALARYQRERTELVARLRQLRPAEWLRTGDHEEYSHYSVVIMFRHVALHDMLHAYRIEECLLKKEWV